MLITVLVLILTGYSPPVEVYDYPYSDDNVYLTYRECGDAYEISLSMSPDSAAEAITNFAEFPGMLNPTKTYASFHEENGTLEVYSQYPFSANYFKAVYRYSEEGNLVLLEADDHDYYNERLQRMIESAREGSFDDLLQDGQEILYPGANPYAREMCILLLSEGLAQVNSDLDSGESIETGVETIMEVNELAYNLTGDQLHNAVLSPEEYPLDAWVGLEEYKSLLAEYAEYLDGAGRNELASEVRSVLSTLENN